MSDTPESRKMSQGGSPPFSTAPSLPDAKTDSHSASRLPYIVIMLLVIGGVVGLGYTLRLRHEFSALSVQAQQAVLDAETREKRRAAAAAEFAQQKQAAERESSQRRTEVETRARQQTARLAALQATADSRKKERDDYEYYASTILPDMERLSNRTVSGINYREYYSALNDVTPRIKGFIERYKGTRFAKCDSYLYIGRGMGAYYDVYSLWKLQNQIESGCKEYEDADRVISEAWSFSSKCTRKARSALALHK